jgi:L-fuconolactonase
MKQVDYMSQEDNGVSSLHLKEDVIDPELPICDPHHHLFNQPGHLYLIEELLHDIGGGHNIVKTVFVESESVKSKNEQRPIEETEFVHRITDYEATCRYGKTRIAAGIVGYADLTLGAAVAPVLEAHLAASNRFRGVRYSTNFDEKQTVLRFPTPDSPPRSISTSTPGLLAGARFREGLTCLRDYKLTFDAWLYHTQLMELVDVARAIPDLTIILNHIGGPIRIGSYSSIQQEVFEIWKKGISALAVCHNVFVKLGGLGMSFCGFGWNERKNQPGSVEIAQATSPFYLWSIEKFGPDRCMFESNFPTDKMSYSYTALWNSFKLITKDFTEQERAALFHDTASKVYRL